MNGTRFFLPLFFSLSLTSTALATDGVLEVNQACATKTGCFDGDGPGFPVSISTPGSYRLTGSLNVGNASLSAIEILAERVHVDLNGFSITFCVGVICGIGGEGSGIDASNASLARVRNGTVAGAPAYGIAVGHRGVVQDVEVVDCGTGISTGNDARIERVTVHASTELGVMLNPGSSLSGSTVTGTDGYGVSVFQTAFLFDTVIRGNDGAITSTGGDVLTWTAGGYRDCFITQNNKSFQAQKIDSFFRDLGGNLCGSDTICP